MAGDWIKMRSNLTDDPAVIAIAAATRLDRFAVVGRLHAFWAWADAHTVSGALPRVGPGFVDELVRKAGFAAAMQVEGWLIIDEDGISVPKFDRHGGESAKKRALATDRKREQRAAGVSRNGHAKRVTEKGQQRDAGVTREEKRREEETDQAALDPGAGAGALGREADRSLPEGLDTPAFRTAWDTWLVHWAEAFAKGKPMPLATADQHLRKLLPMGSDRAATAIDNAIAKGLREPAEPFTDAAGGPSISKPVRRASWA